MLPYPTVKIDISELYDIAFDFSEPTCVSITWDNYQYDLLINYVPGADSFVAFGSGAIARAKISPPYFARHTWHTAIKNVTSIWYSDPTLLTGSLSLYWYYGDRNHWPLFRYAFLFLEISKKLKLDLHKSLFYGSSGGGFSSLFLATILRSKASVINPQTSILNYSPAFYKRFQKEKLKNNESSVRLALTDLIKHESYVPDMFYLQNMYASRDVRMHLVPLIDCLTSLGAQATSALQIQSYVNSAGHSGMPDKALCIEKIQAGLKKANNGRLLERNSTIMTFYERIRSASNSEAAGHKNIEYFESPNLFIEKTTVEIADDTLTCSVETSIPETNFLYAFYVHRDGKVFWKRKYDAQPSFTLSVPSEGAYDVRCYIKFLGENGAFLDIPVNRRSVIDER